MLELIDRALAEDVGEGDLTTAAVGRAGRAGAGAHRAEGARRDRRACAWRRRSSSGSTPSCAGTPTPRRASGARAGLVAELAGSAGSILAGRAGGAELPRPAVGHRDADRALRAGGGGDRACASSTRARPRRGCARSRRRRCAAGGGVSHRNGPVRRDPRQGEPRGAGGRRGGGGAAGAGGGAAAGSRSRSSARRSHEVADALDAGVPRLLLDNMDARRAARARWSSPAAARSWRPRAGSRSRRSARWRRPAWTTSASGALTHSAPALDFSLLLEPARVDSAAVRPAAAAAPRTGRSPRGRATRTGRPPPAGRPRGRGRGARRWPSSRPRRSSTRRRLVGSTA